MEIGEVLELADDVALGDHGEHGVTEHSHDEEDQHQQDKHIEQRVDGHNDRFEQLLQALIFTSQAQHTGNAHNTHDTGELRTYGQQLATTVILSALSLGQRQLKSQVNQTGKDDEEIELIPSSLEVVTTVYKEFEDRFDEEDSGEEVVRYLEEHNDTGACTIVVQGHLQHIENNADHNCTVKVVVLDKIVDFQAYPRHHRFVSELVRCASPKN